jgi:hypothetical protein
MSPRLIPFAARQASADLGFFWAVLQKDRDVLLIELPPRIREVRAQVLVNLKVGADKAITKAFSGEGALPPEHYAKVSPHPIFLPYTLRISTFAVLP